jgi:hypothetical protein
VSRATKPKHLTPAQQAAALAEWGGVQGYSCCVCRADVKGHAATNLPTVYGFQLGACHACERRMRMSPKYRRQALQLAQQAATRTLFQRTADLAGVTGAALLEAMPGLQTAARPTAGELRAADIRLSLPAGTMERSFMHVLGVDLPQ